MVVTVSRKLEPLAMDFTVVATAMADVPEEVYPGEAHFV